MPNEEQQYVEELLQKMVRELVELILVHYLHYMKVFLYRLGAIN